MRQQEEVVTKQVNQPSTESLSQFQFQFVCHVIKDDRFGYLAEVGVQVHNTVAELLHVLRQQLVCIGYPVIQVSHFVVGVTSVTQSEFRKHTTYTHRRKA